MIAHLRAAEHYLPYGIIQCHLPSNTGFLPWFNPAKQARFTYPVGRDGRLSCLWSRLRTEMICLFTDSHPFK